MTAVVVSWNTVDLLDACLRSLRAHAAGCCDLQVIVVDNASTDGSAALVEREWPDVELIANTRNEGYSRANNTAIARATGDHLLLINADAMVEPGCLERLLERMDDPRVGAVGPRLVYGDGTWQRWTAGREPGLARASVFFLMLDRLAPLARRGIYLGRDTTDAFQPDWVSSACYLVRRRALEEVGLLDETWFAYMDDVDVCRRLRASGWSIWYEPSALAIHLMGQSTKRQTGAASPAALRNFNRYVALHHGRRRAAVLRGVEAVGFGARSVLYGTAARITRKDSYEAAARAHRQNLSLTLERASVTQ